MTSLSTESIHLESHRGRRSGHASGLARRQGNRIERPVRSGNQDPVTRLVTGSLLAVLVLLSSNDFSPIDEARQKPVTSLGQASGSTKWSLLGAGNDSNHEPALRPHGEVAAGTVSNWRFVVNKKRNKSICIKKSPSKEALFNEGPRSQPRAMP